MTATDNAARPESEPRRGAQQVIQEKMISICELIRKRKISEDPADEETKNWYKAVKLNGLCGGWVEIHKRQPEKLEKMWSCLTSLDHVDNYSDLQSIQEQMSKDNAWTAEDGTLDMDDVMSLLVQAWQFMGKLENTPEKPSEDRYGPVPKCIDEYKKWPGSQENPRNPNSEPQRIGQPIKVLVKMGSAGNTVVNKIKELLPEKEKYHYVIHIDGEHHHMSVRAQYKKTDKELVLKVVETEKNGIVPCSSWMDVAPVLEEGLYPEPSTEEQEVCISRFLVG